MRQMLYRSALHGLLIAPLLALTACARPAGPCNLPVEPVTVPRSGDECGAGALSGYLNRQPTGEVKAGIAAASAGRTIRYIGPGDAVTHDYRLERLNVELGEDGAIVRFRCG